MAEFLGGFTYCSSYHLGNLFIYSEWSEIEDKLGNSLQIAGGCMDRYKQC